MSSLPVSVQEPSPGALQNPLQNTSHPTLHDTPMLSQTRVLESLADDHAPEKTVGFVTLGCKANLLESSALAEQFRAMGWEIVPAEQPAALYVFNTCTVTERADAESRRLVRKLKRQNPQARVAVTGCYAQVSPDTFKPLGVDFIIGNNYKDDLPRIVVEQFVNHYADLAHGPVILVDEFEKSRELATPIGHFAGIERTRGSMKIQDGCDYKCTYCIIWQGRGPSRSLPATDVVAHIQRMVTEGFKDITLTGINIGQYLYEGQDLAALLRAIYTQVSGDYQVRLSSLDPLEVTEDLMQAMAQSQGKVAPHVHLSSQSADDGVLKAMARRHHVADLMHVCNRLVELMPDVAIGSDMIVGFPTETPEAFERSFQVIERIPMYYLHVFRYSPRPGTPAATMRPQVQDAERKRRARVLIALAEQKKQAFYERFMGRTVSMLCEQLQLDGSLEGITENYLRVRLPATDVETHGILPNSRVSVTLGGYKADEQLALARIATGV
jgi:threonylcarbamoyladenosine tRNA methylthiotransferase MtaB